MTGGLMQLSAYGAQDVYLTGNPQITFFKMVYRKYTNFAMENIEKVMEGPSALSQSTNIQLKCKIGRNADLVSSICFLFDIPNIFSSYYQDPSFVSNLETTTEPIKTNYKFKWIKNLGTSIIQNVNISIGGQIIYRHYGEWLNIWAELNLKSDKLSTYNKMIGNIPEIYDPSNAPGNNGFYPSSSLNPNHNTDPDDFTRKLNPYRAPPSIRKHTISVPLLFWFCQYSGHALPLIALQYHDVELVIELRPIIDLYNIIETSDEYSNVGEYTKPNPLRSDQNIANFISQTYGTDNYSLFYDSNIANDEQVNNSIPFDNNIKASGSWDLNSRLDMTYIFLDEEERKRFAKVTHEYLIEQVSRYTFQGLVGEKILDLPAQHPVKKIIFVTKRSDINSRNDWTNYTNWELEEIAPWAVGNPQFQAAINKYTNDLPGGSTDPNLNVEKINRSDSLIIPNKGNAIYYERDILKNATLLLNGVNRQSTRNANFFNLIQPYYTSNRGPKNGIYLYSFSLEDSIDYQPKGSCNFSRVKSAQLQVDLIDVPPPSFYNDNEADNSSLQYTYDINVYVVNYNILRILSGMGSLAFAN